MVALFGASVLLLGGGTASAAFLTAVVPVVTPAGGGLYSYAYTVTNTAASTVNIGAFHLGVSDDANLSDIAEPSGFLTIYTAGYPTIEFASTDASTDITPGSSDSFSFLSSLSPSATDFANQSYDDGSFDTGTTLGPNSATVPEPTALASLFVGVGLLGRRRRFQKA